jgi:hypothetical protein
MVETSLKEISKRLKRVEQHNRYMKLAGVVFISVVVVSLLAGAAKKPEVAKEIKAQRIVMVDSEGRERIVMEENNPGGPIFKILSSTGESMFYTFVMDDFVTMMFLTKEGKKRVSLMTREKDSIFKMYGKDNIEQISFKALELGSDVFVKSPDRKASVGIHADLIRSYMWAGGPEKSGVFIEGEGGPGESGEIVIRNKTGESVVHLYADKYGKGVVGAYNRKGMGRTLKPGP